MELTSRLGSIKPLVNEYAKNLSLLFITNEATEVREYVQFFSFLFKKLNFTLDTIDSWKIYNSYNNSIDLVIVHVNEDINEFKDLIQSIRKLSNEIYILVFTTNEEKRINFNLSSCFCADGFMPAPFDKDTIYLYLYRFLKRMSEKKELNEYVKGLEFAHKELLNIEERFKYYIQKLKNIEDIDKEKLILELCNIKNRVQDNFDTEEKSIKVFKKTITNTIAQEKLDDIRFTQHDKMTASEFIETLDDTIIDKAEDFLGMLDTYTYTLDDLLQSDAKQSLSHISSLTSILREFYYTVDTLTLFPVIVRTFDSIINFLNSLNVEQLEDSDKKSTLVLILEGLGNDLESWITNVFINRMTDDIHYFDASFANNTLEMEAIFTQTEIESDEDDLEFF